ncbi:MAG: hypothetical protein HGA22_11720, partial [Clostridiales bacterium]|nr:hypothetical protein [Clostridiales bacterium]
MIKTRRFKGLAYLLVIAVLVTMSFSAFAAAGGSYQDGTGRPGGYAAAGQIKVVAAGQTWTVEQTTRLSQLRIETGGAVNTTAGHSLTMTVNSIGTAIAPGNYRGDVVITVADENPVAYKALTHYFRQGIYVDGSGYVAEKSVPAIVTGGKPTNTETRNFKIISNEEAFNGVYVKDAGNYSLINPTINFKGNGGNDFAGYGAAVMATGTSTKLVVDGASINTKGAVRTGIVAAGGSSLVVKNSEIYTQNGILPADYVPTVELGAMKEVPWMLGLVGNCRATNLLGNGTKATYINSSIAAEGWGVLSTDDCSGVRLTSINSRIGITGKSGYGAYAIGNAVDAFYGSEIDVPDYAVIITGGSAIFASSASATVAKLNSDLGLGLTAKELKAIRTKQSAVRSGRFGVMWHGSGSVDISDGTIFDTGETAFLVKGASATINVDGSKGAQVRTRNGVLVQLMDNDDPGPVNVNGKMLNQGVYKEPIATPAKESSHDLTTYTSGTDTLATFSNIELKGDIYNSTRGGTSTSGSGGGGAPPADGGGAPPEGGAP